MEHDYDGPRPAVHSIRPDAGATALLDLEARLFGATRSAVKNSRTVRTTTVDYFDRKTGEAL